ncbi:MAG: D-glycero-beta-D-manno-heptose-7-phosphate kinase [Cytophagales bacterium]|nr:D-glycero-beta-D-manno-heptose-7-phosphate kinase [Cytophagales bacterium]
MPINSIDQLFDTFIDKKVLVLGDVMLDTYVYGAVRRISPEAPVPVINVDKQEKRLGGAANVALNIQALGATPILCSVVGDDDEGVAFGQLLKKRGITDKGIIRSQKRITTVKHRVLSGSQHLIRIDLEQDDPLNAIDKKALLRYVTTLIDECDLVIFEDYDKGCLDDEIIQSAIDHANEAGKLTAVDPKKRNFLAYKNCTLFKPNLKEMREGLKMEVDPSDENSLKEGVDNLNKTIHAKKTLITLSEHGMYYHESATSGKLPAHLRSISDVSGAGDTVISIAALAMDAGMPLSFVAELANLGGGIVCESPGVVPISMEQLKVEAKENGLMS